MHFNPLFDLLVIVVFALMITVLVFMHELGHYLFARLFGMGVEEFAVGMGTPRLGVYGRRTYRIPLTPAEADEYERGGLRPADPEGIVAVEGKADREGVLVRTSEGAFLEETTEFTFRAWPVGGFVRIKGMMPDTHGKEVFVPGGFYSKPPLQRLMVLFAGPMFSVLTGLMILVPYLMIVGKPVPKLDPVIGTIASGLPADKAGFHVDDRIVSIDGNPISNFYQVVQTVTASGEKKELTFVVNREGKLLTMKVAPALEPRESAVLDANLEPTPVLKQQPKMGFGPTFASKPEPFLAACTESIAMPFEVAGGFIGSILHPSRLKDEVGGPIAIVSATAEATKGGVRDVLSMAAMLTISLGVINLLPIVPLDGGQMVMAFAELLRGGKRLSFKTQNAVATAGIAALAVIVFSVVALDIQRLRSHGSALPDEKPPVEKKSAAPAK